MGPFEYILLGLVVLLMGLMVFLIFIFKQKQQDNQPLDTSDFKGYMQKEFGEFKTELSEKFHAYSKENHTDLDDFRERMMSHIEKQMTTINEKVEERLSKGFKDTNETFHDVIERLSKIDEAQKKIEALSADVVDLSSLLSDKKSRGTFGEVQLYTILESVMGNNKELYETQKQIGIDKVIVDALIHAPEPLGDISVDSKFPLENYQRMVDKKLSPADRAVAEKEFKKNVKMHIDVIASKYIIDGVTADQAFMFIPAEAIFAEIAAYHEDIIIHSQNKRVWLVSPTTLISTLTTILTIVKNIERDKQTTLIREHLRALGIEFDRYMDRWNKLDRTMLAVTKDAQKISASSKKISRRFKHISDAKFEEIDLSEEDDLEVE